MTVTDEQVATLRAQLAGQLDEHKRLLDQLDPAAGRGAYPALVAAAFTQAVQRRFTAGAGSAQVIEFVGDVRSRASEVAERLDPRVAERLIRAAYSDEQIDDIPTGTSFRAQVIILAALISDEHLGTAGIDEKLAEARKLADQWLT